jgi:hypothetical protein
MPMPVADRERRIVEVVVAHDPAQQEDLAIRWRGSSLVLPVIALELDAVVLNPRSHRIRSQLESHPRAEIVEQDPFSDAAQDVIREILRDSENFEDLRTNLAEDTQLSPGLVTRAGLLVNANRRAVALGDLGQPYVKVAVLPADAREEEIADLELRLQMQADFREDYSYTNRLLFVNELINSQNRAPRAVARALNLAASSDPRALRRGAAQVDQDLRVLAMIRDVQRRSGGRIPLTDFDDQEVALEELDDRYRELQRSNPDEATELYELRLLGVLSAVPYRDIRLLEPEAVERYVVPIMTDDELLGRSVAVLTRRPASQDGDAELEGLDVLEMPAVVDAGRASVTPIVDLLASTRDLDEVELPTDDGSFRAAREDVVDAVRQVLRLTAQERRQVNRDEDRLRAPANLVLEAERKLRDARAAYEEVAEDPGLDHERLRLALERCAEQLRGFGADAGVDVR